MRHPRPDFEHYLAFRGAPAIRYAGRIIQQNLVAADLN
jgi:hypothetical protein